MTQSDYRYQLDDPRITGRRKQKTTCPHCGRTRCFVRYVDTRDDFRYLSDRVGRCDHEQSCGYHYRPSEYFRDHPWLGEQKSDTREHQEQQPWQPPVQTFIPLDMDLVIRHRSHESLFCSWLLRWIPDASLTLRDLRRVLDDYYIGAARWHDVVFWQIDEQMQVHTGHIMAYGLDGHRCGNQSWIHCYLIKQGLLPKDYQPPKCFFGQHLLTQRPAAPVAIVESEKTAIVMALLQPQFIWLATAGCGGLTAEKTACLRGRRVYLFPDSGCYKKWHRQMQQTEGIQWSISNHLEDFPPNTDLVDVFLPH